MNIDDYAKTLIFEEPEESMLFEAVMHLPKKYRQVMHLYYYEDYSVREISKLLGASETAVSTQLLRGRQKIKKILTEVWKDEE